MWLPKRLAGVLVFGPLAGALAGGMLTGTPAGAAGLVSHPQDDYAGAQIARYEGAGPGPVPTGGSTGPAAVPPGLPPGLLAGLDVSAHQGSAVPWPAVAAAGALFGYVKATESTDYLNPAFAAQFTGARAAGLIRGAYHFAIPNASDAISQAEFFVANGGAWARGGYTLPPAVDLEYNPYGEPCYGMPPPVLVGWIGAFVDRVRVRTGRYPVIYTSALWWRKCTADYPGFAAECPLWIAHYAPAPGPLPAGWTYPAIWQYADSGPFPGDQDAFNGTLRQLRRLAAG